MALGLSAGVSSEPPDGSSRPSEVVSVRTVEAVHTARAPHRVSRQLWVWHPSSPATLTALARRNDVDILLVWVSPGFSRDKATMTRLTELRRRAAASRIRVDALGGDTSWLARPAVASAWAAEVRRTRLFSHIHLDVEPQSLRTWSTHRTLLSTQLLRVLTRVRQAGMPVDADIPYWFWRVPLPGGGRLDEAVLRRVSSITIMAYQSSAAKVTSVARPQLAAAARLKRRAFVGVNIGSPGGDSPLSSFAGQPVAAIRTALVRIDGACSATTSCAGIAVHHASDLGPLTARRALAPRATRR